jgi:hypothetical protein
MLAMLLLGTVLATGPQTPPKGWIEVAPPATAVEWQCANYSLPGISLAGSTRTQLRPHPFQETRRDESLPLPDGALVGSDHGEFGGTIEWRPKGKRKAQVVVAANTQALLAHGDEAYAITGLAHLSLDDGQLLRLRRGNGTWSATPVLDLVHAPQAWFKLDPDHVLIATTHELLLVDLSQLTKKTLHENTQWWNVYPNSVQPFGDAIAIGVRGGVILLRPEGQAYRERWWVPARCRQSGKACPCSSLPEYLH